MVNENIKIKDKYKTTKKFIKIILIVLVLVIILVVVFSSGYLLNKPENIEIIIENPLTNLVLKYTDNSGVTNKEAVIEQAVIEFNEDYITYILVALGTSYLHSSFLKENPVLELVLDEETWSSEIIDGMPYPILGESDNEDLRITMSKEEAVEALLSKDIRQFMKDSVYNKNTKIEMIAGKTTLFSKGYLDMYKELTGEEVSI